MSQTGSQKKFSDFLVALFLALFVGVVAGVLIGYLSHPVGWLTGIAVSIAVFLKVRNDFSATELDSGYEKK